MIKKIVKFSVWALFAVAFSTCQMQCEINTHSKKGEPSYRGSSLYNEGLNLLDESLFKEAAQKFEEAAKSDPKNFEIRRILCQTYVAAEAFDKAQHACFLAQAINPLDEEVLNSLGILNIHQNQYKEAVAFLHKAHEIAPQKASILENLTKAYIVLKNCEKAAEMISIALRSNFDFKEVKTSFEKFCSLDKSEKDTSSVLPDKDLSIIEGMIKISNEDSNFLIDEKAATGLEYSSCVDSKVCKRPSYDKFNRKGSGAKEPAMSVDYYGATDYCKWKGKRLPTLEEYELSFEKLQWEGCCVRGVIPREWTLEKTQKEGEGIQIRKGSEKLTQLRQKLSKGVDSSTVRCAISLDD